LRCVQLLCRKEALLSEGIALSNAWHSRPTVKSGGDKWARLIIPRIFALLVLNRLGIAFDYLAVIAFAIPSDVRTS
jgi:hypothetical protein